MTNPGKSYALALTVGEADHLLLLVSIGQLALAENKRSGWLPAGATDAGQMAELIKGLRLAPPIDRQMQELGAWFRAERKK